MSSPATTRNCTKSQQYPGSVPEDRLRQRRCRPPETARRVASRIAFVVDDDPAVRGSLEVADRRGENGTCGYPAPAGLAASVPVRQLSTWLQQYDEDGGGNPDGAVIFVTGHGGMP